jgi:cytochrome c5
MSESSEHESVIKTPKQLIYVVLASFLVPIITIILLATFVTSGKKPAAGTQAYSEKSIAERIAPVARAEFVDANAPKILRTGEQIYKEVCAACHATGAAGAPKTADTAAWAPRIKTGYGALLKSVINGKGAMAARAGNPDLGDTELGRAVVYMANGAGAGAQFKEPAAPAPVNSSPSNTAASVVPAPAVLTPPVTTPPAATATKVSADAGKKLYETACISCHASGVANAPKFADKAAWAPRIALGNEQLTKNVISGKGAMPPKGGSSASEEEIKAAVVFMTAAAK